MCYGMGQAAGWHVFQEVQAAWAEVSVQPQYTRLVESALSPNYDGWSASAGAVHVAVPNHSQWLRCIGGHLMPQSP